MIDPVNLKRSRATPVDRAYQIAYRWGYQVMRLYWRLRRPNTRGSLVALWNRGDVLLVRNSYVRYYGLPGGYVRRGEDGRQAALRELFEEVGVAVRADDLELLLDETHDWEGKRDHVQIFTLELATRPEVQIDHREVVEAMWSPLPHALTLELFPPLRRVLEARSRACRN
jgi:8-oxo-dGTP pyrophosphatase MutT (NUDIX family)